VANSAISPVARGFAWVNIFNFSLILLPVTRYSIWLYIFGISFDRSIKFHRWLARWTLLIAGVHGLLMIGYYAALNNSAFVFRFDPKAPHYTLAGTIAWACMFVALLFTFEPIRRRFWEIFQFTHVPLGICAIVFAIVHATVLYSLPYFAFSILLYGIDLLLRFGFGVCQPARLVSAEYNESAAVTKLVIAKKWPFKFKPGEFVFIWIDKVSLFEWHPFSICEGTNADSVKGETLITLQVKNMARDTDVAGGKTIIKRWTERLSEYAKSGKNNGHIRVEGPYGHSYWDSYDRYETVILFAGGIGITPVYSVFKYLKEMYQKKEGYGVGRKVFLIWVIRTRDMIDILPELRYLANEQTDDKTFNVKIFITREDNHNGPTVFSGRPSIRNQIRDIVEERKRDLNKDSIFANVQACGVGTMTRDVQSAVWHANDLSTRVHFQSLSFAI
jgi:NAD(P)H-flavin reductase